jgi:hypothetical protein
VEHNGSLEMVSIGDATAAAAAATEDEDEQGHEDTHPAAAPIAGIIIIPAAFRA